MTEFKTLDSGSRQQYDSGMQRDTEAGKARPDLQYAYKQPYDFNLVYEKVYQRYDEKYRGSWDSFLNWIFKCDESGAWDVSNDVLCKYGFEILIREAKLKGRGVVKYNERNWETANSKLELMRFKRSAFRHIMQDLNGDTDEDHIAAVLWNINSYMIISRKTGIDVSLWDEEPVGCGDTSKSIGSWDENMDGRV